MRPPGTSPGSTNGHYMDQFTYAERATDWRGNNNIAESIFGQLALEEHPIPRWIVVGAGTGGTSATIGRYLRYHRHDTELAVVDPENSAFYPGWLESRRAGSRNSRGPPAACPPGSRVSAGRGWNPALSRPSSTTWSRSRTPPRWRPCAICNDYAGLHAGPSTGTNLWGVWQLIAGMIAEGRRGSVVSLMCDGGDRYAGNYYNPEWLQSQGLDPEPHEATIRDFFATGTWPA